MEGGKRREGRGRGRKREVTGRREYWVRAPLLLQAPKGGYIAREGKKIQPSQGMHIEKTYSHLTILQIM